MHAVYNYTNPLPMLLETDLFLLIWYKAKSWEQFPYWQKTAPADLL